MHFECLLLGFAFTPSFFLEPMPFRGFLSTLQLSLPHFVTSNYSKGHLVQTLPYCQNTLRHSQSKPNSRSGVEMKSERPLKWEVLSNSWAAHGWWEISSWWLPVLSTAWCKHCQFYCKPVRINARKTEMITKVIFPPLMTWTLDGEL